MFKAHRTVERAEMDPKAGARAKDTPKERCKPNRGHPATPVWYTTIGGTQVALARHKRSMVYKELVKQRHSPRHSGLDTWNMGLEEEPSWHFMPKNPHPFLMGKSFSQDMSWVMDGTWSGLGSSTCAVTLKRAEASRAIYAGERAVMSTCSSPAGPLNPSGGMCRQCGKRPQRTPPWTC